LFAPSFGNRRSIDMIAVKCGDHVQAGGDARRGAEAGAQQPPPASPAYLQRHTLITPPPPVVFVFGAYQ
jgi:hypothetical protein